MKKTPGFTLIELMISVAIIGILASIAYPSYLKHVLKGRRVIAQGEVLAFASAMEQYYVQNGSDYRLRGVDNTAPAVYANTITLDGVVMYNITLPSVLVSSYTIRATPIAGTAQDGDGYVQITSTGAKSWDSASGLVNHW